MQLVGAAEPAGGIDNLAESELCSQSSKESFIAMRFYRNASTLEDYFLKTEL
jgi:hypothetical protein